MRTKDDALEGERPRRSVVIAVSLGIAVFSTSFVVDAFSDGRAPERSRAEAADGPVDNGSIYFRAENDQGQSMGGIVEPDGSGQGDAFPGDPAAQHQQLSFSPDGTRMAFVDGREGTRGIYVANPDGSNAVRLTDQANDSWPNWSPDGTKIAFVGTRFDPAIDFCHPGGGLLGCPTDIYTMGVDGSNVTDITDDPGFEFDPAWSPDGTRIAFASTSDVAAPTTITVMNADGTGREKMSPSNGGSDFHPSWSSDGTQIVFGGIHYEDWGLFEVRADGIDQRTLLFGVGTYAVAPAWSPDGSLIAFGGNVGDYGQPEGIFAMRPDGSGITKLAEVPDGWAIHEIAWRPVSPPETASGVIAFARSLPMTGGATVPMSEIWLMNEDGSDATEITDAQRDGEVAAEPSWSPDGARIAFVLSTPDHLGAYAGDGDIAVMNADGSNVTRLTAGLRDAYPVWSPDGSMIAFERDQQSELDIMNADGSGVHRLLSAAPGLWDTQSPSWSPGGSRILYTEVHRDESTSLSTIDVSDGTIIRITHGPGDYTAAWSPDGRAIVFARGDDLYRMNVDGTQLQRLTRCNTPVCIADFAPSWSADGRSIAFVRQQGGGDDLQVYVMPADGSGDPHQLTEGAQVNGAPVWRPMTSSSPSPAPVPTASVTGTFDGGLQGQATGLTYGFGSLWVDGFESPSGLGQVIRLDAQTGKEQADISIGSVAPGWEVGGGGIAIGDGSVWIVGTTQVPGASPGSFDGVDTVLVRIDPSTNRVVDRIVLGGKIAADIAIDANGVWVLFGGDDDKMQVARVDPATDQVVATIPLQQAYGHYLFSVDGAILAFTNETTTDRIGNSVVNVIDPSTDTITTSVSLGDYAWPAAGDGSVWAAAGTTLERIDPGSGSVTDTWPLDSTGDSLSVGAGGVWSVGPMGRSTVSRWNPALMAVDLSVELPPGAGANVIATSTDSVWVLSFDGTITRIQLSSN